MYQSERITHGRITTISIRLVTKQKKGVLDECGCRRAGPALYHVRLLVTCESLRSGRRSGVRLPVGIGGDRTAGSENGRRGEWTTGGGHRDRPVPPGEP